MRRIKRKPLPKDTAAKLKAEQTKTNAKLLMKTLDVEKEWKRARRNIPLNTAFSEKIVPVLSEPAPDIPQFLLQLEEADDYGLLGWCFRGNGINEKPLSDLRETHPAVWTKCERAFQRV